MVRVSLLLLVISIVASSQYATVLAGDDKEEIIGVWERETEKDGLEETWAIKKTKDKWSVSGSFWKRGKNGEVGNFKGKDVKFADGTLTFTQEYFKVPKGRESGMKITASAEGDRLDFTATNGKSETKDNMERAGDASEFLGAWNCDNLGMKEIWTIEKDKKGVLSVRGTYKKDDQEVGSWKGLNVRYFKRTLWFNQQFDKLPTPTWVNGAAIVGVSRGGQLIFAWEGGKQKGKGKLTLDSK